MVALYGEADAKAMAMPPDAKKDAKPVKAGDISLDSWMRCFRV